jgi:phage N-6-adenine-methyltransferase
MPLQKAMVSSKSNEWETPQALFNELDSEFHFTLDPCATPENAKCVKFHTAKENGLKQDWGGEVVFMNPPYGGHTGQWLRKAWHESQRGVITVCLIVSSTDRSYWHDYIFPYATEIRWLRGRIRFGEAESTAPFASAIVIFAPNKKDGVQKQVYFKHGEPNWQYPIM